MVVKILGQAETILAPLNECLVVDEWSFSYFNNSLDSLETVKSLDITRKGCSLDFSPHIRIVL